MFIFDEFKFLIEILFTDDKKKSVNIIDFSDLIGNKLSKGHVWPAPKKWHLVLYFCHTIRMSAGRGKKSCRKETDSPEFLIYFSPRVVT